MTHFAQIDPQTVGSWVSVLAWLVGLIVGVLMIIRFFKPSPPAYRAEIEAVRAELRAEDNRLHGRVSGLRDEIKAQLEVFDKRSEERLTALQTAFQSFSGQLGQTVGRMESSIETLTRANDRQSTRLDRLLEPRRDGNS